MELNRDTIKKLRWLVVFTVAVVVAGVNYRKILGLLGSLFHCLPVRPGRGHRLCAQRAHALYRAPSHLARPPGEAEAAPGHGAHRAGGDRRAVLVTFVVAPELLGHLRNAAEERAGFAGVQDEAGADVCQKSPDSWSLANSVEMDWDQILKDMVEFLEERRARC